MVGIKFEIAREIIMTREKLSKDAITAALAELGNWSLATDGASIKRSFVFKNFSEAFAFMTKVAFAAEKLDHHPDWSNSWNKVTMDIVSHEKGAITETCVALADKANGAAGEA